MITPDPSGWTVAIIHPDTGRVKTPDVLDLSDAPAFNPGPNSPLEPAISSWLTAIALDDTTTPNTDQSIISRSEVSD